ncbi:MAG TPA: hypothetical protein VL860_04260 [Planctomycetota bacterium]|nr:hypothetical protein [Planctomycetota bacterium]
MNRLLRLFSRAGCAALLAAMVALAPVAHAGQAADPTPVILPEKIYEHLAPGTVLLNVNGVDLTSDTFCDAVVAQLAPADRNALIQAAQIREELRARDLDVTDREIDAAADQFAQVFSRGLPKGQVVNADQLIAVLGIDRTLFKRFVGRFVGLRKILLADNQIAADTELDDDRFKKASDAYLKLLQMKFPARAGTGDTYVIVGRTAISRMEAVEQYRSSVWSKAYQTAGGPEMTQRAMAGSQALNNDVLGVVDRIMRYQVVYARWNSLKLVMDEGYKDRVLQDIEDALASRQGSLGQSGQLFDEFLRRRQTSREAFKISYEFEMTCMLSQMVEPKLTDAFLEAIFKQRPGDFGKGDPIVAMIFVPTQDEDGQALPMVDPTGLAGVDNSYERLRLEASAKSRQTLRLAALAAADKGFAAAAEEFNKDPVTQSTGGKLGSVPLTAHLPRFTAAMMKEIKRLSELPAGAEGQPIEGKDGWYLFRVEGIENPTFASVRHKVFVDAIGTERVKLQDELMHNAKLSGLLAPGYRAYLDAVWKSKYETPAVPEVKP